MNAIRVWVLAAFALYVCADGELWEPQPQSEAAAHISWAELEELDLFLYSFVLIHGFGPMY